MSKKTDQICQMESVRLKINEHMTLVGEEILCVLEKQQCGVDVFSVKLNVRVFVLERLSAAAEFMCNLFQREMETLEALLERQHKLMDIHPYTADILHPVCKEEVSPEEERSPSVVQEEPEPPHIKEEQEDPEEVDRPMLTLAAVKIEDGENRDTEPVASTSTEHMKTQAYIKYWVPPAQPTGVDQLLSSHCSESDITEDSDEWEPSVDQCSSNKLSQDLTSSKETHSTQSHTGKKSYSCTVCCKIFNREGKLKRHMRTHTGEKPFICEICKKGFSDNSSLKTHMRTHTGEKPFTCTFCDKGFRYNNCLKRHLTTHTGEKSFTCKVCKKGFSDNSSLKTHMRIHTGEKPFTCTVCGKGFSQVSQLKPHMRTHTGEKPFACTLCNKSFCDSGSLKTHMRTHTGERFTCTVCNKSFSDNSYLKAHLRTHTEGGNL